MRARHQKGANLVEYGLLVAAIALASVVSIGQVRDGVARLLGGVVGGVSGMSRCIDAAVNGFLPARELILPNPLIMLFWFRSPSSTSYCVITEARHRKIVGPHSLYA